MLSSLYFNFFQSTSAGNSSSVLSFFQNRKKRRSKSLVKEKLGDPNHQFNSLTRQNTSQSLNRCHILDFFISMVLFIMKYKKKCFPTHWTTFGLDVFITIWLNKMLQCNLALHKLKSKVKHRMWGTALLLPTWISFFIFNES